MSTVAIVGWPRFALRVALVVGRCGRDSRSDWGVVERCGHDFELFGSAPKISKLGLILGGIAAKNNIAADSPPARPSADKQTDHQRQSVNRPGQLLSISLAIVLEAVLCFRNNCVAKRRELGRRTRFNTTLRSSRSTL